MALHFNSKFTLRLYHRVVLLQCPVCVPTACSPQSTTPALALYSHCTLVFLVDCQCWLVQMNSALSAVEARRPRQEVAPLATAGNVCSRKTAGLDVTTISNLANHVRL